MSSCRSYQLERLTQGRPRHEDDTLGLFLAVLSTRVLASSAPQELADHARVPNSSTALVQERNHHGLGNRLIVRALSPCNYGPGLLAEGLLTIWPLAFGAASPTSAKHV